jgi:hypothetical protein
VLVIAGIIAWGVIWACYGFRYAARPEGTPMNPTLESTLGNLHPAEAKAVMMMAHRKVLPESWLYGLADVRSVANTWPSYIFGKIYAHGVWFYFPVAFVIKATLTTLTCLLCMRSPPASCADGAKSFSCLCRLYFIFVFP